MRGKTLNAQAQQLVLNLCEYFELEKRNGGPLEPVTSIQEVSHELFTFYSLILLIMIFLIEGCCRP